MDGRAGGQPATMTAFPAASSEVEVFIHPARLSATIRLPMALRDCSFFQHNQKSKHKKTGTHDHFHTA